MTIFSSPVLLDMGSVVSVKCKKAWVYILDGVQMFGGILRDEAVDGIQSVVFSY